MFKSLIATLSLLSYALAQNSSAALQVEAIEAHFQNAHIVPDLLKSFTPVAAMAVDFSGVGQIQPGQALSKDQVAVQPSVTIEAANSTQTLGNNFTILMVDADVVGADLSKGETRHWLVNSVSLSGTSGGNQTVDNSSASAITDYAGPAPASGSGAHRYTILLYTQPSNFTAPDGFTTTVGVDLMDLASYVNNSGLQGPVAGTYFTVEEGTASSSVQATSAVVTSTLANPSSTGSATGSGASSGASSGAMGSFEGIGAKTGVLAGLVAAFAFA